MAKKKLSRKLRRAARARDSREEIRIGVERIKADEEKAFVPTGTNSVKHIAADRRAPPIRINPGCLVSRQALELGGYMVCQTCFQEFEFVEMDNHFFNHHSLLKYSTHICPFCHNRFASSDLLRDHEAT